MILINYDNENYTINKNYELHPNNDFLLTSLEQALSNYNSPSQGFKTSFVAEELKKQGLNIIDVYDEGLEDSPEGIVY